MITYRKINVYKRPAVDITAGLSLFQFRPCFFEEFSAVYEKALMSAFTDKTCFVGGSNVKGELSSVYRS